MRTHSTFSILFWIYSTRAKDDLAPIYVRITVNGKKLNLSLKRRIALELWDSSKQRIRGKSLKARNLNQYLDEVHTRLFQCYQELRALGKPITAKAIKNRFLGDDDNKLHTLRDIFQYHNATQFEKLHRNTSRLYITSQKYILNFLKKQYKCSDILLQELDYKFILDFESYLRSYKPRHYQKRIGNNAVMKHIQRLR